MQVVILAGGLGTRLQSRTKGLPKALVRVGRLPLLEHLIRLAVKHGTSKIFVMTGHRAEAIREFCGDGSRWGVAIECVVEEQPRGTAGAVIAQLNRLPDRFLVMYGDTLVNVDLSRMMAEHIAAKADATLFAHPNEHPEDSDLIEADHRGRIVGFHPYPHAPDVLLPNLVNAALYVLERDLLRSVAIDHEPLDFGRHVFPDLLRQGVHFHAYRSPEYIKDAGTPLRLDRVERDIALGIVSKASLEQPCPAVFLDRDGTLNNHVGYLSSPSELELIPGVGRGLRALRDAGFRLVVVTNQPIIARGMCSEEDLRRIHNKLEMELGKAGAFVDAIYVCPHHPDGGFHGERPELKVECGCRKPQIGLIRQAALDLHIALDRSWMIGDTTTDIELAHRAGLRSIMVETGERGKDRRYPSLPDFVFPGLPAAADFIARRVPALMPRIVAVAATTAAGDVVLVGGQARSGKSTLAQLLRFALAERNQHAVVVPLDSWIRSESERMPTGGFFDRHDTRAAAAAIAAIRDTPGLHRIGRYDRAARVQIENGIEIETRPGSILIVEGVSALLNTALLRLAKMRIAVRCPDSVRLARMRHAYRGHELSPTTIERIIADRSGDEVPLIEEAMQATDMVLDLGMEANDGLEAA
jgi:histidinol-phosphate phosphatase family protein